MPQTHTKDYLEKLSVCTCGAHGRDKVGNAASCLLPHLRTSPLEVAQRVVQIAKLIQNNANTPLLLQAMNLSETILSCKWTPQCRCSLPAWY